MSKKKIFIKKITFWSVAIIVLTLLILAIIPNIMGAGSCGIGDKTCVKMKGTVNSLKMFKLDNTTYPTTEEGLHALQKNPNPKQYPNYAQNAYVGHFPSDGWKNPLIYLHYKTDKGENFELIFFGADGKYGGKGANKDKLYSECE